MMNPPRIGLFCKTFKPDLPWLFHALQSIELNWRHDWASTELLVVAEPDCESDMRRWAFTHVKVRYVYPFPCGYCHAMMTKLCADLYLRTCRLIWLFDSDMLLTRPTTLDDIAPGGMPRLIYDEWHSDFDSPTRETSRRVWVPAVKRSMGLDLDRDWMVNPLWVYWSSTFQGARELIESHRQMPFLQAVYCPHRYDWRAFTEHPMALCDMQALGLYAHQHEAHLYAIGRKTSAAIEGPIRQAWSHSVDGPSGLSP